MEGIFEEVARQVKSVWYSIFYRDFRCIWMSAVEFIDAETILGADSSFNLITGEVDRTQPDDKQKMKVRIINGFCNYVVGFWKFLFGGIGKYFPKRFSRRYPC